MDSLNSDIQRRERIKALLEQLQGTREALPQAMEKDRMGAIQADMGYNAEKIARAFSKQSADRKDYEFTPQAVPQLTKLQESIKGGIEGSYDEALQDPSSSISGAYRDVFGSLGAMPKESIADSSAKEMSYLQGPLKIKADIDQAATNAALKQAQIDAQREKANADKKSQESLGLKEQAVTGKIQSETSYMTDPTTPRARASQAQLLSLGKNSGLPFNEEQIANMPAEAAEKLVEKIMAYEGVKIGPKETTARIAVTKDADLEKIEKQKALDAALAAKKAIEEEKLKKMGLLSNENIASGRNKTALEIAKINADARAKAGNIKGTNIGKNQDIKALPDEEQRLVRSLADTNAKKIAIANQISSTIDIMTNPRVPKEQKIQQGRQLLKVLNSTEGKDAVGAEEAHRLGSYLEFSAGINLNSPRAIGDFGLNLPGFVEQSKLTKRAIVDSINENQKEIQRRYKEYGIDRNPVKIENKTLDKTVVRKIKSVSPETRKKLILKAKQYLESGNPEKISQGRRFIQKLKLEGVK